MLSRGKAVCYFFVGCILFTALWQLEMVYVARDVSWGYDFGGFGQLGLELWQWRDVWYAIIFVDFLFMFVVNEVDS